MIFGRAFMAQLWQAFLGLVRFPHGCLGCPICGDDPEAVVFDGCALGLLTNRFSHSIVVMIIQPMEPVGMLSNILLKLVSSSPRPRSSDYMCSTHFDVNYDY